MYMDNYTNINKKGNRNKKGFTLIELIVVILILGIIAGVAVPKIVVAVDKAEDAKFYTDMHNLRIAAMTAHMENPQLQILANKTGSDNTKQIAEMIAKVMGREVVIPYSQKYNISGVEVPGKKLAYFTNNKYGVYLRIDNVKIQDARVISNKLGYGEPSSNEEPIKNLNTFWVGASGDTRHMLFALVRFD